jgi:phosphatidylglycerol:prolipoprotein diacylglycerol transferase
VALGALVGLWVFRGELRRSGLSEAGLDAAMAGLLGGMAGAKLLWVFEHFGEDQLSALVFSRGGLSWFGGFAGGVIAGLVVMRRKQLPALATLAAATPGLAIGHAIGRIGCFLVGDDYGLPTTLPWGVAFPKGLPPTDVPVHPTQLYEAAALLPVFFLLLRLRQQGRSDTMVLGSYLVAAGAVRFAIEFLRVDRRVLAGLSVAHLASLAAIVAGFILLARGRGDSRAVQSR